MHRLLLIFSLFPLLAALILRKINADRHLHEMRKIRLSMRADELVRKMLDSMARQDVEIKVTKRPWAGASVTGGGWLKLPASVAGGTRAADHGRAALYAGLYLLSQREPGLIARRRWAMRFGHVFPIFTTLVVFFALFVRMPPVMGLSIILASLALATCAQFLTVIADLRAASMAAVLLEKKRILPRLSEEEAVITAARAWAWHAIVPGLLSRLM